MNGLMLLNKLKEKGINPETTLRKITLMFQLSQLLVNLTDEIEADFRLVGAYKMQDKQTLKQLNRLLSRFLNDLYPNLTQEQIDEMIEDLDELEKIIKEWAQL